MENQKHTPEPWDYDDEYTNAHIAGGEIVDMEPTGSYEVFADGGEVIICIADKANARRIVAAVNAVAGIETKTLEALPSGKIARLKKERDEVIVDKMAGMMEMDRLRPENERLRDALEAIANHFDMDGYGNEAWKNLALEMANIARAALSETAQPAEK